MDNETKREIWIISVSALAAVPALGALGFVAVTGLIGMMRTISVATAMTVLAVSAFPAVAQSIGGAHKAINQLGGVKPVTNPVVARAKCCST
jgi:hypothetical protein